MNGEGKNEDLTSEIHVYQLPTAAVTTVMVKVNGKSRGLCVRSLNWVTMSQNQSAGSLVLLFEGAKEDCLALFVCCFCLILLDPCMSWFVSPLPLKTTIASQADHTALSHTDIFPPLILHFGTPCGCINPIFINLYSRD